MNEPAQKRVCIIGAGSSGLAAIQQCLDASLLPTCFEAREGVGGAWRYEPDPGECQVQFGEDGRCWLSGKGEGTDGARSAPTPMYQSLRTNVPIPLMQYRGTPFPSDTPLYPDPSIIQRYLETTSEPLLRYIAFNTRVTLLRHTLPTDHGEQRRWSVEITKTDGGERKDQHQFDYVMVANGHYAKPFVPFYDGLSKWEGEISHSRWYRSPELYKDKGSSCTMIINVLVVGNSASGYDVARETAESRQKRREAGEQDVPWVAQSARGPARLTIPFNRHDAPDYARAIKLHPGIESFGEGKQVKFVDGSVLGDVDIIVFATGYFYSFPFASTAHAPFDQSPLTKAMPADTPGSGDQAGLRLHNLDERLLFYVPDPTLSFLALHLLVIPFPLAQVEARLITQYYASRLSLDIKPGVPSDAPEDRALHTMGYPKEHDFTDSLLKEMGEGGKGIGEWKDVSRMNRELRQSARALRFALLAY